MTKSATPAVVSERPDVQRPVWQRDWLSAFLLIALVFVSYARVLNAGFIWDDESHLTQNPCVVGPLGLKDIWTTTRAVYYPLVLTTFWILHKAAGLSPSPYHILNILMHAGSAVLLPAVLALCVWWRHGRIQWRDVVFLVPFMLISALASAWTIWEQKFHAGASGPEWAQTWPERLIIAGRAIWFYLGKLVWPH